jgi:hypothetical protein
LIVLSTEEKTQMTYETGDEDEEDENQATWKFETSKLFNASTDWYKILYSHWGTGIQHRGEIFLENSWWNIIVWQFKFFSPPILFRPNILSVTSDSSNSKYQASGNAP